MTAMWKSAHSGHIFRCSEFTPILIISDELKQRLESARVTGIKIYKPEEFSLQALKK
jgi:hypothetical protein